MSDPQTEQNSTDVTHRLIEASYELEQSLAEFREINQKTHFIALNAAVEGARMKSKLSTFSIVANQITQQATKNGELSNRLEVLIHKIERQSLEAVSVRNLELAADLIDKLDRNLFERNCDVQAWATFDSVIGALASPSEPSSLEASEQLEKLVGIYMVYTDSFLVNTQGMVVAAARRRQHLGANFSRQSWFRPTASGQIHVTDLHFFEAIDGLTVCYCAPVLDKGGQVLGVLANCFDWSYALEMIQSGDYSAKTRALVIDANSRVIASKRLPQLLQDHLEWLKAGEWATQGALGFSLEKARNGESMAIGFCHTKGYNAYKGKGWSAVVSEDVGTRDFVIGHTVIGARGENADQVPLDRPKEEASALIESEHSGKRLISTMKEIDELVYEINANNREVKLLAVNASVQAGLAGEDGEGFSVIANEVAGLARKSLEFVGKVNSITERLHHSVLQASSIRLLDAAKDTMSKIDRNLFERYCDIQAWATFSKIIECLESGDRANEEVLSLLAAIHKIYEVYHDISIVDLHGRTLGTAVNRNMIGGDNKGKDWFTASAGGRIFVSDIYSSSGLKMPLITFSAPVYNRERKMVGVIASRFNCNFLNDILRAAIIDSGADIFLLNKAGKIISAKDNSAVLRDSLPNVPVLAHLQAGAFGRFEQAEKSQPHPRVCGYSVSKGYNSYAGQKWVLVTRSAPDANAKVTQPTPAERFRQRMKSKMGMSAT